MTSSQTRQWPRSTNTGKIQVTKLTYEIPPKIVRHQCELDRITTDWTFLHNVCDPAEQEIVQVDSCYIYINNLPFR